MHKILTLQWVCFILSHFRDFQKYFQT